MPASVTFIQQPVFGQPATAEFGAPAPATYVLQAQPGTPAPAAQFGAPAPATYALMAQPGMAAPAAQFGAPVPVAEAAPAAEAVAEGEDVDS